jgi:hypothetical protein
MRKAQLLKFIGGILITSSAKKKGAVFLKRIKKVWNWIPTIERNIKLPPSIMSQSFLLSS